MAKTGTGFHQSAQVSGDAVEKALARTKRPPILWIVVGALAVLLLLSFSLKMLWPTLFPNETEVVFVVKGKVTLNGIPVKSPARIVFSDPATGNAPSCELSDTGEYSLGWGETLGIPEGTYTVFLTLPTLDPSSPEAARLPNIPAKYLDPSTTDLEAVVGAESTQDTYDFELSTSGRR